MRTRLAPLMLLLAAACSPVIAETNEKGGTDDGTGDGTEDADTDVGADTDSDPGTDTDTDDGTDTEDPEPSTEDWAGGWTSYVFLEADGDVGGGQEISCEGEMAFEFDEDGDVEGEGMCSVGGWAEAALYFEGEIDADGEFDGVMVFSQDWIGDTELDVQGSASGDSEIDTEVEGTLVVGGWGGDYEVPLYGDMVLERE